MKSYNHLNVYIIIILYSALLYRQTKEKCLSIYITFLTKIIKTESLVCSSRCAHNKRNESQSIIYILNNRTASRTAQKGNKQESVCVDLTHEKDDEIRKTVI